MTQNTQTSNPKTIVEDQSKNPPPINVFEVLIRRFARATYMIVVLLMYVLASFAIGLALAPALWLAKQLAVLVPEGPSYPQFVLQGTVYGLAFITAGLSLMFTVVVLNKILPTRCKPFKGGYYTIHAVPWFLHNGLFY